MVWLTMEGSAPNRRFQRLQLSRTAPLAVSESSSAVKSRQSAGPVSHVAQELFGPPPAPLITGLLPQQGGVAEIAEGGRPCLFLAHADSTVFGDLAVEMEAKFLIQLGAGGAPSEKHGNFHGEK